MAGENQPFPWRGLTLPSGGHCFVSKAGRDSTCLSLTATSHMEQIDSKNSLSIFSSLAKNIPVQGPELTFYSVREVGQDPLHFTGQWNESLICRTKFSLQMGSKVKFWGPILEGSPIWPQILTIFFKAALVGSHNFENWTSINAVDPPPPPPQVILVYQLEPRRVDE